MNIAVPDQEPGIDAARVFGEEVLVSLGGPARRQEIAECADEASNHGLQTVDEAPPPPPPPPAP